MAKKPVSCEEIRDALGEQLVGRRSRLTQRQREHCATCLVCQRWEGARIRAEATWLTKGLEQEGAAGDLGAKLVRRILRAGMLSWVAAQAREEGREPGLTLKLLKKELWLLHLVILEILDPGSGTTSQDVLRCVPDAVAVEALRGTGRTPSF